MYEHRGLPLLTRREFVRRLGLHGLVSAALVVFSLMLGMAGYTYFEHLGWLDAFLNSAMLLGGMGPVDLPRTDGGKLFAALYALYSGLVFLAAAGVLFAPVFHRIVHKLHIAEGQAAAKRQNRDRP